MRGYIDVFLAEASKEGEGRAHYTEEQLIVTLIDFFTDQVFWTPAHRAVTFLSSLPEVHVYEYLFTHEGAVGYADMIGLQNYSLGVAHADDLHYLFNGHGLEFPALVGEDFTVRDIFVNMWTISIHDGNFISKDGVINSAAHHAEHHLHFTCNYGQYFTWWDRIFGTHREPDFPALDPRKVSYQLCRE